MDSDYYSQSQVSHSQLPCTDVAGTIMRINMKNFMCHDNFEVPLNSRINFICGKNGSGKSAIQTAIAVGLGGKALATNRGSSLKALIKNDKNSCTIVIQLSNKGPLAYKPQEYGDFILVERFFSQSSQGYKLKNRYGKVVSTEKKELDKIVAQFNIQTDNPVCILHQDVARNFLSSSDPKNKFKFYMKASRFDEIAKLYRDSNVRVLAIKDSINGKFEVVEEAFRDVIELKKRLKTLEDAKEKENLKEHLEMELVWARIHESNLELKGLQKRREMEISARKTAERKLQDVEENKLKERLNQLEENIKRMDDLVKDAREKLRPAREDYSSKKEKFSTLIRELNEARKSENRTNEKYKSCLKEIENLNRNAPDIKQRQEKLKSDISKYEQNLESLRAAERNFEHERQQLKDTVDNVNGNIQSISEQCNNFLRQKRKREDQIKQIGRNASNLSVYGDVMIKIVDEVNKAASQGKFQKKPVGPIGMHIKVRDPAWAGAVENFLGKGFLSTFCVDNVKDSDVLSRIFNNICSQYRASQPAIIRSKFLPQMHKIEQHETLTRKYTNLVRALDIDNTVVANCLIDQQDGETVLLIPTNNEAYQLLDEQQKVPRNCKRAFTLTGDQFYPAPNYKSYSSTRPVTHATLLQANQKDVIRELKREIQTISQDMSGTEAERQNFQQQLRSTLESLKKNEHELRNLKNQRYSTEQKIQELKTSTEPEMQTNVGFFVEESKELASQLERVTGNVQELVRKYERLKAEAEEAKTVYAGLENTIAESDREKAPIQADIQQLQSTIQQASAKVDLMNKRIKEHDKRLSEIDTDITGLSEKLTQNTENATQICDPVQTQRSTEEVQRELRGVIMYLKKLEEQNGGSLEELQRGVKERQTAFNAVNQDLDNLRKLVIKKLKALRSRRGREDMLRRILSNSAKHNFQTYLNERHFDGKLEFDFEAETLEIKVKPFHEKVDPKVRKLETSSLSGGEKSFSTVCFIMALWQEVELPFHFLDEFDVFMDGINRRVVMDLLTSYAKGINQQFVFLTPLDMSSINVSDIVTIHRLEAPRQ